MNERDMVEVLCGICEGSELFDESVEEVTGEEGGEVRVSTFEQAGILTTNQGLVVRVGESEFQVTVVQVRR